MLHITRSGAERLRQREILDKVRKFTQASVRVGFVLEMMQKEGRWKVISVF